MGFEMSKGILDRIQEKKQKKREASLDEFRTRWQELDNDEEISDSEALSQMADEFSIEEDSVKTGLQNIGLVDEDRFDESVPQFKDRQCHGPDVWDPTDQTCKHPSELSDQAKQARKGGGVRDPDTVSEPDNDPMTPPPETPQGEDPSNVDTTAGEPQDAPQPGSDDNLNQKNQNNPSSGTVGARGTRGNVESSKDRSDWARNGNKEAEESEMSESVEKAVGRISNVEATAGIVKDELDISGDLTMKAFKASKEIVEEMAKMFRELGEEENADLFMNAAENLK